ncbi:NUDIX domain-containing protein [Micromonospora sp. WMMD1102]|uniref:NUDIX hydrolase n=1 Tax=Micromonospora sp. WMMD1102 TaxID=3016105 RepID=UPI002415274B|nr:NUDIX domain-containing protein [Micromonospora sp. WMMD1102]MDG4789857.1 NUDIX domain-containing protein [Micromonospora sp. WMMD1102]
MRRRRRIGAYGLCRDGERVLLVRGSAAGPFPGVWQLPGGDVAHGEHPRVAVHREFAEETGLAVAVTGLRAVLADVIRLSADGGPVAEHTDRVVYDVEPTGGTLRAEPHGGTDRVAWLAPEELAGLVLMPFTAELLGRPADPLPESTLPTPQDAGSPAFRDAGSSAGKRDGAVPEGVVRVGPVDRYQRFAAYGLATDPAGRILLTRIATGFPGAGRWHLPGGGTDHGEQPVSALLRELVEETGQLGRVTGLLHLSHRHNTREFGPEGRPLDWHGVRAIYRVEVDAPTEARVVEATGGSTDTAGWFSPADVAQLPRTEVVDAALSLL